MAFATTDREGNPANWKPDAWRKEPRSRRPTCTKRSCSVERVRPKMMTVVAIMAGLLPIMWSTGTGSEVMQRIAVPMIGGMVSSTVLTLVVIPAVYTLIKGWSLSRAGTAIVPSLS